MSFTMNEYDIETAQQARRFLPEGSPLDAAIETLGNLVSWTNRNSDGWAYWRKPLRASAKLQEIVDKSIRWNGTLTESAESVTAAEVKKAMVPIKAFLTRCTRDGMVVWDGIVAEVAT